MCEILFLRTAGAPQPHRPTAHTRSVREFSNSIPIQATLQSKKYFIAATLIILHQFWKIK